MKKKILILTFTIISLFLFANNGVFDKIALNGNWLTDAETGDTIATVEWAKDTLDNYVLTVYLTANYYTKLVTIDSIESKIQQCLDTAKLGVLDTTATPVTNQLAIFTAANKLKGEDSLIWASGEFDITGIVDISDKLLIGNMDDQGMLYIKSDTVKNDTSIIRTNDTLLIKADGIRMMVDNYSGSGRFRVYSDDGYEQYSSYNPYFDLYAAAKTFYIDKLMSNDSMKYYFNIGNNAINLGVGEGHNLAVRQNETARLQIFDDTKVNAKLYAGDSDEQFYGIYMDKDLVYLGNISTSDHDTLLRINSVETKIFNDFNISGLTTGRLLYNTSGTLTTSQELTFDGTDFYAGGVAGIENFAVYPDYFTASSTTSFQISTNDGGLGGNITITSAGIEIEADDAPIVTDIDHLKYSIKNGADTLVKIYPDSAVFFKNIIIKGNFILDGTIEHHRYEEAMFTHPDSTVTTSATTTWQFIGDGQNNKFTHIISNDFSFNGDTLQFDQDASDLRDSIKFRIHYSCTNAASSVNETIYTGIFVKHTGGEYIEIPQLTSTSTTSTAGIYYPGPVCTAMPIWLQDGDNIQIRIKIESGTSTLSTKNFKIYMY